MRTIAVANQKGGCGKTTTSVNFAASLSFLGKKVLLIDLDPQGHSSCGLGIQAENLSYTLYQLLSPTESPPSDLNLFLQQPEPNIFVLPSYGILAACEEELAGAVDREKRLKREIARFAELTIGFDYAVIDCPPNIGLLTLNALEAADEVMIPVEPSFFSLHGLAKIYETIQIVSQRRAVPLGIHALLTLFDSRTSFAREVYDEVKAYSKESLFKTIIHERVTFREAAGAGQSVVKYAPQSAAFQDYLHLATEYLGREWDRLLPPADLGWRNFLHQRYGPRRVVGGVLFQVVAEKARWVEIAGDFNQWIPEPMIRSRVRSNESGIWQIVLPIGAGTYRYKFIVDGEWQIDPYHPVQRQNAFGTFDSYLELV